MPKGMLGGRDAVGTSREASGGSKKVMTFETASEGKRNKFWKWHAGTGEKGIYMMIKGKGSENSVLGIGIKAGDSRGMQATQRRMNSVLWERGSQWELQNWKASFIKWGAGSHFGGSGQGKWWEIDYKKRATKKNQPLWPTFCMQLLHLQNG